jgi:hypothetical protein
LSSGDFFVDQSMLLARNAPNKSLDASGGSVFRNLLDAAEGALIRAARSTQTFGGFYFSLRHIGMKHHHIRVLCGASEGPSNQAPRMALTPSQRSQVLAKTAILVTSAGVTQGGPGKQTTSFRIDSAGRIRSTTI